MSLRIHDTLHTAAATSACIHSAAARRQQAAVVWAGKQQQTESSQMQLEQQHATEISEESEDDEDEYGEADEDWEEDELEDELEEEEEEEDEQPVSKVMQIPVGQTTVAYTPVSQQVLRVLHCLLLQPVLAGYRRSFSCSGVCVTWCALAAELQLCTGSC
jgi:hypothetical protein